jgi:hypothetical protein
MPNSETTLAAAEARLTDLWQQMVRTVGIHTVNVLMDRAIWEASQKHPELALIQYGDTGLSFEALDKRYASRSSEEVADAFGDLTSQLLLILTRLLGREMAQRMAQELEAKMPRGKHPAGRGKALP